MINEILISTALALANSPDLCKQKNYDALYRTLVQIDFRLADAARKIESKCTADFKVHCKFNKLDQTRLDFYRTFRYNAVMAMRKHCNGKLSTFEQYK